MGGLNGSVQGTGPEYGYLWIGELYRDDVVNRFGGNSEEALETNRWVPCGDPVSLFNNDGIEVIPQLKISFEKLDTFDNLYKNLQTLFEVINSIFASFDGRFFSQSELKT